MPAPNLLAKVLRVSRDLNTGFDAQMKSLGLTSARARVMLLLARNPEGVSQGTVTETLDVEHPTAVRILDGLEGLGYIARQPAAHDRRAKQIVLTPIGRPIADQVEVLTLSLNSILLDGLDDDAVRATNLVLDTLIARMADLRSSRLSGPMVEDTP